jgi:outer membrane protein assembly factor BamE (lipoprotein component of BamABCDE complex)
MSTLSPLSSGRLSGAKTRAFLAACVFVLVSACTAQFQNHGYTPSDEDLSAVLVGVDTRASVEETVGRPSASGVLQDEAWYYISSRVRTWAYRAPQTIEREIVAISFDEDGTVANIERFGLADGQVVTLSRRITETSIREFGLIQNLLRNFGRIDIGGPDAEP